MSRFEQGQGVNRETFAYQTWRQGGEQYGNMTEHRTYEWVGGSWAGEPYRTRYMFYYPNETIWIVNKQAREDVYQVRWDASGAAMVQQTFTYYDQTDDYTTPPTQGLAYRVRTGLGSLWQDTYYAYWANGNLYKVTDANGHATRTYYDGTLHALPVCTRNALGHETKVRYYGVQGHSGAGPDDVSCTTASGSSVDLNAGRVFGQVEQEEDANGALTTYRYDRWGRLVERWRPGEEMSRGDAPTEAWVYPAYTSTSAPFVVRHRQRDDADGGASAASFLETWTVFDGLGQVIQTQTEAEVAGVGGKRIVEDKGYDAMGRVAWESVPYGVSSPGGDVYIAPQTQPKTHYAYDALGRVTTVTHPDGTQVRTFYSVGQTQNGDRRLVTTIVDENNHQTVQRKDALGRLRRVDQYKGEYGNATRYASARYDYDVLDRMTDVYGPGQNEVLDTDIPTHIDYDALGRKTSMSDPDMGAWGYEYDAVGNLTRQTDARGCVITFSYDALNRLTGKSYSGPNACGSTAAVSYTYDQGAYGKGRRTGMSDGSGSTTWEYDARGRVTKETKTITGAGTFVTQWSYDAMDRVKSMIYPRSEEEVTFTYNSQGLPLHVTSNKGVQYVANSNYDDAGRILARHFGNNTDVSYAYYDWDVNGSGRLKSFSIDDSGGNQIQGSNYWYDAVGNVKSIRDATHAGQVQCFSYDYLDRLTDAFTSADENCEGYANVGSGAYEKAYHYLANGNLESISTTHPQNNVQDYHYDSPKPHAVTTAGDYDYEYDANGNMIVKKEKEDGTPILSLTYDHENRLISTTNHNTGVITTYVYDGDGKRVKMQTDTKTIYYVGNYYEFETATPAGAANRISNDNGSLAQSDAGMGANGDIACVWGESDCLGWEPISEVETGGFRQPEPADAIDEMTPCVDESCQGWHTSLLSDDPLMEFTAEEAGEGLSFDQNAAGPNKDDSVGQTQSEIAWGFETGDGWNKHPSGAFPGSSLWRSTWGTATPYQGKYAYAISDHAYGYLLSDPISVSSNVNYSLSVFVRGKQDADDSRIGGWTWGIKAFFYDASGKNIGSKYVTGGNPNALPSSWTQRSGAFTTPGNTTTVRILLIGYLATGWVGYDDVSLQENGAGPNLISNPGFEGTEGWTAVKSGSFPGTSIWHAPGGYAHSGSYAYMIRSYWNSRHVFSSSEQGKQRLKI